MKRVVAVCILLAAGRVLAAAGQKPTVGIVLPAGGGRLGEFAAAELSGYLSRIYPSHRFPVVAGKGAAGGKAIVLGIDRAGKDLPESDEGYRVSAEGDRGSIRSRGARGLIYGVYGLLERLGCGFYLSEEIVPPPRETFSFEKWDFSDRPLLKDRYVFNWHNFLSGCTGWDRDQWFEWIDRCQKMGYNTVMVHAYHNNPMHAYSFRGVEKESGLLCTSAEGRDWCNIPVNDVRRLPGGEIFREAAFGCRAAMGPRGGRGAAVREMMRGVFARAAGRGVRVCFAFDADTAIRSLQKSMIARIPGAGTFTVCKGALRIPLPESPGGQAFYTAQVKGLLDAYPTLNEIACWRRGSSWFAQIDPGELPKAWRDAYDAAVRANPFLAGKKRGLLMDCFVTARLVSAYRRALDELGRPDVEVATGAWNSDFVVPTAAFLPDRTKLMPIDWNVRIGKSLIEDEKILDGMGKHARGRVVPFFWAHHDDGQYIGRSYRPAARLCSKLKSAGADACGVFHWMNRPHDLYFKNTGRQIWAATADEPLEATCRKTAADYWGDARLGRYLLDWITDAPIFGRATQPNMHYRPWKECTFPEGTLKKSRERIAFLDAADTAAMTDAQKERLRYFRTLEQFIAEFVTAQRHLDRAEALLKEGRAAEARGELGKGDPEQAVRTFSRLAVAGKEERGEMAYLITLAGKWIGDYDSFRQRARMLPIKVKLGGTVREPAALGMGGITYHIDQKGKFWEKLGAGVLTAANPRYPGVSCSAADAPAENAVDGRPGTRWASRGAQWIEVDLGAVKPVGSVSIDFYKGGERAYGLEILTSADARDWQSVFKGKSSPAPSGRQEFRFGGRPARYVRILGDGNSQNDYNAYSEIEIGRPGTGAAYGAAVPGAEEGPRAVLYRRAPAGRGSDLEEILSEGLVLGRAKVPVRPIMRAPGVKDASHVPAGRYVLTAYAASEKGGRFSLKAGETRGEFDVRGGGPFRLGVVMGKSGPLTVEAARIGGEVALCGLSLEPVDNPF